MKEPISLYVKGVDSPDPIFDTLSVEEIRQICIILQYDGSGYHGWQVQPGMVTIQELLEGKLQYITKEKVRVIGAGRTDAGVHALGQVATFRTASKMKPGEFVRALNSLLPGDIRVQKAMVVSPEFHPQFRAKKKTYLYLILNRLEASALLRHRCWHVARDLSLVEMQAAAAFLIGRHDFNSFKSSSSTVKNSIRELMRLEISQEGPLLELLFEGDGFLKNMVRNMVGTLVEVGLGRFRPEDMTRILEGKERRLAGPCAPPQGLYLLAVEY